MTLKEAIQRHRNKGESLGDIKNFIYDIVSGLVSQHFAEIKQKIESEVKKVFQASTEDLMLRNLKGKDGRNGVDGRNAIDGLDGRDGKDGRDGIDGKNGQDGKNGKDGSSDTSLQIIDKINTTEQLIEQKTIRGLSQLLLNLQRSIKDVVRSKGGGGIGNLQHETFNVGISTTTITTAFPIAMGGLAIWADYNGQNIFRGTHYTVGVDRKILTLTFTPQNSTVIDLIYIRG